MLFGAHISSAGGLENAPERASLIGCEVFQMFSRSPQIWKAPELKDETVELFNENMKKFNQKECYIHTSFLINLASVNNKIRHGSMNIIKEELERGSRLGAKYVMTHLGSYKDVDSDLEGPMMVVDALKKILDKEYFTELLIEISAGAGNIVGCTFEELAYFMEELKGYKVGICLDTAHMFASGYDLRNKKAVTKVFDDFDRIVGTKYLRMSHLNDSKVDIGERKDRHEDIGVGKIGIAGFEAIFSDKRLKDLSFVLETPGDMEKDLRIIKEMRKKLVK